MLILYWNVVSTTPPEGSDPGSGSAYQFAAGQKLFDRYTLSRLLGRGGMGVVWLAHDENLDQDVALKFLSESMLHDPNAVERLKKETRHCLQLTHSNIVRIYDFVQSPRVAAIAMEHVDGWPLSAIKVDKPNQCFTVEEITPWIRQLCDSLEYAHTSAHIVHRDLKPGNLLIDARGQLKVSDFGVARNIRSGQQTTSQAFAGTVEYMSPQQAFGEETSVLDDIYSLGATIFELLTGTPPFYKGDILAQVRDLPPPSMTERLTERGVEENFIPYEWDEAVAACLAKDPARRPQSAAEVLRLLGTTLIRPTRSIPDEVSQPAKFRKKLLPLALGAVAIVLTASAFVFLKRPASSGAGQEETEIASARQGNETGARDSDHSKSFVPLFNGQDLTGWHAMPHHDPRKVAGMTAEQRDKQKVNCKACGKSVTWAEDFKKHWRVVDGELVNDGYGPYATTDKEFGDIELQLQYKTVPKADSGVYLRGSPQVQIWDYTEAEKFKHGADKGSGGLWNNSPGAPGKDPLVLADKPFGEWNKLLIIQAGDITTVYLNDKLVVDHAKMENFWDRDKPLFSKGPIQLQTHGGEIRWRNIYVRELTPDEAQSIKAKGAAKAANK